jgi:hypothetical protein|nr:MAG TPA_asm: hypothetical protein [Caudoviricetes sp.]
MWIRSQNKKILSKVNEVLICTMDDNKYFIEWFWNRGSDTLGIYSSEEKALKVLDQIQYNMEPFEHEPTMVFQMPADEDVEV